MKRNIQMKLCWDNLENLQLGPRGNVSHMIGVPWYRISDYTVEFENYCEWCGNEFIKRKNSGDKYCDTECKKEHTKWKAAERRAKKLLENSHKINYDLEKRKKISEKKKKEKKIKTEKYWKQFNDAIGYAKYDSKQVQDLMWCEEVRRSSTNPMVVEVKCIKCGKWFRPTGNQVHYRYRSVIEKEQNGQEFYCSDECKKACPLSYMTTTAIMKMDAKNAGRIWLEIDDKWKYYDWQIEYKQWVKEKQEEYSKFINKVNKEKTRIQKIIQRWTIKRVTQQKQLKEKRKNLDPKHIKSKKLLYYSKVRAKQKKLKHNLDLKWIQEQIDKNCAKTKLPFSFDLDRDRNPFAPSIDRKDNNKGYTKDNCQVTIWAYNCGKGDFNEKDLYIMAKAYLVKNKLI